MLLWSQTNKKHKAKSSSKVWEVLKQKSLSNVDLVCKTSSPLARWQVEQHQPQAGQEQTPSQEGRQCQRFREEKKPIKGKKARKSPPQPPLQPEPCPREEHHPRTTGKLCTRGSTQPPIQDQEEEEKVLASITKPEGSDKNSGACWSSSARCLDTIPLRTCFRSC